MKLVCLKKVEVLQESETVVRSARSATRIPAVVRLVRFVNFHRWDVKFSRENIYARDRYRCQYCGDELRSKELTCYQRMSKGDNRGCSNNELFGQSCNS